MRGHVYVIQGDITKCQADAIGYSSSIYLEGDGKMYASFAALDGFSTEFKKLKDLRDWNVGDVHWLARPAGRGIVVSFTTGQMSAHPIERSQQIVRNAIQCAVENLRRDKPSKRLLILLPSFLTGSGGGGRMRADLARAQVGAAADTIEALPGVDVGFVLFHPADHEVYREARRAKVPGLFAGLARPDPRLVDAVRRRECALFVGAGVSAGAGMPSWAGLIEQLRLRITEHAPTPSSSVTEHLRIAQLYRDRTVEMNLVPLREVVRGLFGAANRTLPTLAHYLLAGVRSRNVITTNYDHLLEDTIEACRQQGHKVTRAEHVPQTSGLERVNIVKFHGDAEDGDDVVVSQRDYDDFFQERPAFDLLLAGLLLNQSFLFLGYSLKDPNFQQIYKRIANVLGAAQRPTFATSFVPPDPGPDPDVAHVEVVPFEGTLEEQTQLLWRWLDQLVDDAIRPESLLLSTAEDHVHVASAEMSEMRAMLLDVGNEVQRLSRGNLAPDDARALAGIAEALFARGWRAHQGNHRLLADLAVHLAPADREPLLLAALAQADSEKAAATIQKLRAAAAADG